MRVRQLGLFLLLSCLWASGQQAQQTSASPSAPSAPGSDLGTSGPEGGASTRGESKATSPPDLTPDADGSLSQKQMRELFRVVADKDAENNKKLRDYTYIEREVQNKLDSKGQTKSAEVKTYEILEIYGEQIQRLIAKDDKPLESEESAKEEEKIQKIINKRKNESENDRKKRAEKEQKDREDGRKFVTEIADAYDFKLVGTELVDGHDTWAIDGEPRPGFVPHMKESKFLSKFHGRVWIDKGDLQLAKMEVECLDTISWGVFLARFHKGSRFMVEQTRVNDEVWLPLHLTAKVDVRLALLKNFNVDVEQSFRDYRKFRTSAKIVGMGEVQEQK
jgi:hypothetical protein